MIDDDRFLLRAHSVALRPGPNGGIVLNTPSGTRAVQHVQAAFPLSNPGKMVMLRDAEGKEIGLLDDAAKLEPHSRRLLFEALERSYFMPRIEHIEDIAEQLNVLTWRVVTDRGPRTFQVRHARKSIRRLGRWRLVIRDVDGNRYEIPDWRRLAHRAHRLIEEFL